MRRAALGVVAIAGLLAARAAWAQTPLPFAYDGPPPPEPPAVISRDASGKITVRAVPLSARLRIDGKLDEAVYETTPSMSDFIQQEPTEGLPATERTEVWLFFDRENVYISARCWESHPERIVATEMRRDNNAIFSGNDNFMFTFDTFYDRRNGVTFTINALGGRQDGQFVNERQYIPDWNPVWEVKTGRFDGGWTIEAVFPFKSLRYRPGRAQVWGFNAARVTRWKNELSYLARVPASRGVFGIEASSLAATLVGLEVPAGSRVVEIKPFATSQLTTNVNASPSIANELKGDGGLDAKVGLTQNLTADLTYRTDFAQVEADEQQINLTRFNLFFPEKREFFLENQGTFSFGGTSSGPGGVPAATNDTPTLFYSRRVGLDRGQAVPVVGGGRLTGRVGRFTLGALNIKSDDLPSFGSRATDFSVLRLKRDLFRRSSIGLLATDRSVREAGSGRNQAYGVDGVFSFFDNLSINTYWAQTRTPGRLRDDVSYRAQLDYGSDRYGVQVERLAIGDNFNPEVGFLRRDDLRKNFALFRFSPRPKAITSVRRLSWTGSFNYIENGAGRLETRTQDGEFAIEFQSGDKFPAGYAGNYEFLPAPFTIAPAVVLPVAGYDFAVARVGYNISGRRKLSANLLAEYGEFYDGHRVAFSAGRGRVNLGSHLSVEPTYSVNKVTLEEGSFTTQLVGSRVTCTFTPLMFVSALLQYNSSASAVTANVRLRWEYRPGSELFVVYNEQRDTLTPRFPGLATRAVVVKINRLFRL